MDARYQVSAGSPPCDELPAADDVPIAPTSMGLQPRDIFRLWFALTLVVTFLTIGLFTHIGAALHCVGLLAERPFHTFSVLCSCVGFRFLLLINPQIRVTHVGDWDGLTEQGAKMILMNHTSFMDFFLFTAALPLRLVRSSHVRTVISSSLTKIPIVGPAMGAHAGSFVVYFQAKGSGFGKGDATDFSVDREKQQVQTDRMHAPNPNPHPHPHPSPNLSPGPNPDPNRKPKPVQTLTRRRVRRSSRAPSLRRPASTRGCNSSRWAAPRSIAASLLTYSRPRSYL